MNNGYKKLSRGGYHAGHPWYYFLGGKVPTPKQIRNEAACSSYRGYMAADIETISKRDEPRRSEGLRKIRAKVMDDLRCDVSRYRELARKLHNYRRVSETCERDAIACDDIHVSMSLKHAHIFNDFAHLNTLDNLPDQQRDLFG